MRLKSKCINADVVWAVLRRGGRKGHFFTRHRDGAGFATLPLGALEIKLQRWQGEEEEERLGMQKRGTPWEQNFVIFCRY